LISLDDHDSDVADISLSAPIRVNRVPDYGCGAVEEYGIPGKITPAKMGKGKKRPWKCNKTRHQMFVKDKRTMSGQ